MRALMLARSAGFCYGVRRAVELAEEKAAQGAQIGRASCRERV